MILFLLEALGTDILGWENYCRRQKLEMNLIKISRNTESGTIKDDLR